MSHLSLDGPFVAPASGQPPRSIVVFLHGYGADGNDLISLGSMLSPLFPDTAFYSPHAPEPCAIAPSGQQWFDLTFRDPHELRDGSRRATPALMRYLSELVKENGLETDALALVGFSQGTMMALQVAPQFSTAIAGVVGFSGALADAEGLAERVKTKPPVLLIHGEADDVVPFSAMGMAEKALSGLDFTVETMARPGLGHGIDEMGLRAAANFLKTVLPE